jgi:metal-responsive CopG/Arc/MetJ family transcriptional regulator
MTKKIVSIYLDSDLVEHIDAIRSNYSRSSFLENALIERFGTTKK